MAKMIFRVASNPGDYYQCHQLMRDEDVRKPSDPLTFPTILVIEDLRLVGFIGTRIINKMIVAGPLVLRSDRRRIFTALKLAEAYETAMKTLGIKTFVFGGEKDGIVHRGIERYYPNLKPYAEQDGQVFYSWKVGQHEPIVKSSYVGGGRSPKTASRVATAAEANAGAAERAE